MKTCFKITALCAALLMCGAPASAQTYIADSERTTAVDLSCDTSEITSISDTNSIAVTRDGFLLMSPKASGEVKIKDENGETTINVLPPVILDFDDGVTASDIARFDNPKIGEADQNKYLDGTEAPAVLSFDSADISDGTIKVKFSLFKENTSGSELVKILSKQGREVCLIETSRRNDTNVYFSYLTADGMVRERTLLMESGKWQEAELSVDFGTKAADLYLNGKLLIGGIPLLDTDNGISSISFGQNIDNLSISGGTPIDDCTIGISVQDSISAAGSGIIAVDPMLTLDFWGESHRIDAKYCNISAEGTGILPSDDAVLFNLDNGGQQTAAVTASCVVSGNIKESKKTISVTKGGGDAYPAAEMAVYTPEVTAQGIRLKLYTSQNKVLLAAVLDADGNIEAKLWKVLGGKESSELISTENIGKNGVKVFLIDADRGNNLLAGYTLNGK